MLSLNLLVLFVATVPGRTTYIAHRARRAAAAASSSSARRSRGRHRLAGAQPVVL